MRAALAALALAVLPGPLPAQEAADLALGEVQSQVLTVDVDRLFAQSAFGERVANEVRAESEALAAENRQIEADLTAEEQSLTERRPTMEPEQFRAEAQAFDDKVQAIRAEQDAKERALQERLSDERDRFLQAATPVLADMMQASGAAVILDRRVVLLSLGAVDVTDRAVAAIDAAIGDGTSLIPAP